MTPRWLTAFLDLPPDRYDAAAAFWAEVTGYERSAARGPEGQFASLLPPDGDVHLKLQRLGATTPRVHLDVLVDEPEQAEREALALGARVGSRPFDGVTVLRSPGGFTFCLARGSTGTRPAPRTWPDGHTSYVDQLCLDVPPSRYDAELDFWSALTGWRRKEREEEFGRVTPGDDQPLQLLVQRLDDEQDHVTAHLDWATSDPEAEVTAHEAAGATVLGRFDAWTVLRDPAGTTYCVTQRKPEERSA
ncbi:VOC family protein [Nocardioides anomalus]|uniref:VOC family protein n=1 Tax=Nocardioides anomalus TaxID=2712223 RepID=A0A6G6WGJ3_9ACTN|nr:VOC family protein [Nocardioides anomalus]QIG44352.1 VOC family protein [Nocardioides anomalus]